MGLNEEENRRYLVHAPGICTFENLTWSEAVTRISNWFNHAADWGSGDAFRDSFDKSIGSILPPKRGGHRALQQYADDLAGAVKRMTGVDKLDAELTVDEY